MYVAKLQQRTPPGSATAAAAADMSQRAAVDAYVPYALFRMTPSNLVWNLQAQRDTHKHRGWPAKSALLMCTPYMMQQGKAS